MRRAVEVAGVATSVLEEGSGEAVVCVHGVPTSSYLYRKVVPELAARGLRGIAFDLPGLGLAGRPADFDYTWTGLGRWCAAAVDALGLERFHLVVHDIGGPVGFELAAARPERVASLTVLNALIEVDGFRRPWMMEPFARRGIGELWLRSMSKPLFRVLFRSIGVADRGAVTGAEIDAYVEALKRGDGGRAFLRIMRGFERTAVKQALYERVLTDGRYPVQYVWGERDPVLPVPAGRAPLHRLAAKHFLQEDQAPAIAEHVRARTLSASSG